MTMETKTWSSMPQVHVTTKNKNKMLVEFKLFPSTFLLLITTSLCLSVSQASPRFFVSTGIHKWWVKSWKNFEILLLFLFSFQIYWFSQSYSLYKTYYVGSMIRRIGVHENAYIIHVRHYIFWQRLRFYHGITTLTYHSPFFFKFKLSQMWQKL